EALRARGEMGLRREVRRGKTVVIVRMGAVAAAVTLVAAGSYKTLQWHARHQSMEDAAERHAHNFPLEIHSADPRAIADFFHGKVDYAVNVPQLPRAVPAGGRLLNVRDQQAVYISYATTTPNGSAPGRVGLYVYSDGDTPSDITRDVAKNGYNVVTWGQNNITYIVVSDPDDQDVMEMALPPPQAGR